MYLLRRNESLSTVPFWDEVAVGRHAPVILRELVRRPEVACAPGEAESALAWARRQATWIDHPPPVRIVRGGAGLPDPSEDHDDAGGW